MALISLVILLSLTVVCIVGISLEVSAFLRKRRESKQIEDSDAGWTEPPNTEDFEDPKDYRIALLDWQLSMVTETARNRLERIRELEDKNE